MDTSLLDGAVAWVAFPSLLAIVWFGLGLLTARLVWQGLPSVLLLPLGFCASIVLLGPVYALGIGGWPATGLVLVGAAAGLVVSRDDLRRRWRPGPATAGALAVLALWMAPTVLHGSPTWSGYNFLNDTAVHFLLVDRLQEAGTQAIPGPPSTGGDVTNAYLATEYPLGSHVPLAAVALPFGTDVAVVYQTYLAMLAMAAALALVGLARRLGLGGWPAAVAGSAALGSNLALQYGLQGSVKEIAMVTALAAAAALGRELLSSERPARAVLGVAFAFAAAASVLSAAAAPYLAALAAGLVAGALLLPGSRVRRQLPRVLAVGAVATVLIGLPAIVPAFKFFDVASTVLAPTSTGTSTLGQLARPLPLAQSAGVWLSGSYTLPITSPTLARLTDAWSIAMLAALAGGLVVTLRRREPGLALLIFAAAAAAAVVAPRASPYADAKLLALLSPCVVFGALVFAFSLPGRARRWGPPVASVLALGVLWSDALALHDVKLAPMERLGSLEEAASHSREMGLTLLVEPEEYGKYFARAARLNAAFEAITPKPAPGGGFPVDVDQMPLAYVEQFGAIILRRGPETSRPPSSYARRFANAHYEVWQRSRGARVLEHLPLQAAHAAGAPPDCGAVRRLARLARRAGGRVRVAAAAETTTMDVVTAPDRPLGWLPQTVPPDVVEPRSPGLIRATRAVRGGRYDVWVKASTGRELEVRVGGRSVGSVHAINTHGQWLRAGEVELPAGPHRIELERPGGSPRVGDGAVSTIGPVALVATGRPGMRDVAPDEAARLCGRRSDWIEAVAP